MYSGRIFHDHNTKAMKPVYSQGRLYKSLSYSELYISSDF